jgi:hypothetical protein
LTIKAVIEPPPSGRRGMQAVTTRPNHARVPAGSLSSPRRRLPVDHGPLLRCGKRSASLMPPLLPSLRIQPAGTPMVAQHLCWWCEVPYSPAMRVPRLCPFAMALLPSLHPTTKPRTPDTVSARARNAPAPTQSLTGKPYQPRQQCQSGPPYGDATHRPGAGPLPR